MTLPPIPSHLPLWQAGHLAWLASQGLPTGYAVPEGTEAARADLTGAYLSGVDLRRADLREAGLGGADLRGADLRGADLSDTDLCIANLRGAVLRRADLREANLSRADMSRADLTRADLTRADLTRADLTGADLTGADLTGADLSEASLSEADLRGATGIALIGPVGRQRRIIYAVAHDNGPMIQAGCWWGSVPDTIGRIKFEYSDDPAARKRYVAAVRLAAALVTP